MGFGTELQGRSSHDALLRLQDTEIRLLESVKKFVTHRIKCDRDYAQALAQVITTAQKFDANEFETPVIKTWQTILQETEALVKVIQENANTLVTRTLERLVDLINEKKVQRKSLAEDRNQLDNEFNKLKDELGKQKTEYEKSMSKMTQDRTKYEDLHAKGKFNNKYEDAKNKYSKSTMKLHRVHNDYQMSLYEVILHQKQYKHTTLPGLLTFQQEMMETQVEQCKDILMSYANQTDTTKEEFAVCHRNIKKSIRDINSQAEYDDFITKQRSDPLEAEKFEFNESILSSYDGPLKPNQIAVDTFTVDTLKTSQSQYETQITTHTQKRETQKAEMDRTNTEISQLGPSHTLQEDDKNQYNTFIKQSKTTSKDLTITDTTIEKLTALLGYVKCPLDALGDGKPPEAISFLQSGDSVPDRDEQPADVGNADAQSGGGFHKTLTNMKSHLQGLKVKGKSPVTPPKPPNKDFLETAGDGEESSSRENGKMVKELVSKLEIDKKKGSPGKQDGYQQCEFSSGAVASPSKKLQRKNQPMKNLKDEEWFHGILPREDVQRLLRNDGDYLLRESTNRKTGETQYVLSVFWKGHKHFIVQGKEGAWRFEGDTFPTVQELVQYQRDSGNPVTKKSEAILSNAIHREEWELNNEDIDLGMKIGNGNFGEVFKGYYRKKKTEIAIKTCKDHLKDEQKKKFLQEARILMQYDHPNIVRFIGIAVQKEPVMIVMEYVPNGALLQFLRKEGQKQSTKQLVQMCEDASAGMAYLESEKCIHRDLAARNCLVGKKNVVKISDFGMSREEEEYTVSGGMKQIPIKWTAPEALNYGTYTWACDVWSYGILMWEIFSFGSVPYPGLTNSQARERVDEGYRMPAADNTPETVHQLMLRCWEAEPKDRPHFQEIYDTLQKIRKDHK